LCSSFSGSFGATTSSAAPEISDILVARIASSNDPRTPFSSRLMLFQTFPYRTKNCLFNPLSLLHTYAYCSHRWLKDHARCNVQFFLHSPRKWMTR
jgi:hypothetical protein